MTHPRLLVIGAIVGARPGWVTTQGEILAGLFERDGWTVRATSTHAARIPRMLDQAASVVRWRKDIDIAIIAVHTGWGFALADIIIRELKLFGIPTIAVLHSGGLPAFAARHPKWVRNALSRADHLVAPSRFLATQLEASRSIKSRFTDLESPLVIPNTIALEWYDHRTRESLTPRLLWMRTFEDIYNPQMALHAMVEILKLHPEATLTMAGQDRGMLEVTKSLSRELGLSEVVTFAGFLDPQAKRRVFNDHDIYLHTNQVDNTPVSVIEAAAAGMGIVATRVGGLPYLLTDGTDALLVDDGDAIAMAAAVDRLVHDADLAQTLTRNARSMAEKCSWPVVKTAWENLFGHLLSAPSINR